MIKYIGNLVICILIFILVAIVINKLTKKEDITEEEVFDDPTSLAYLSNQVKKRFDDITSKKESDLRLNKKETLKRRKLKLEIIRSLRECSQGNTGAKEYIKDMISQFLCEGLLTEKNVDKIINFTNASMLDSQDKFDILLYIYKKEYQYHALEKLFIKHNLGKIKTDGEDEYFEVTEDEISTAYDKEVANMNLSFIDKLKIITQRIYQERYGLSSIDEIREMKIDGVSGGVSGVTFDFYNYDLEWMNGVQKENLNSFNSIFIFYKGNTVKLSFLGFYSQNELIRVCKNIHKFGRPGQFNEERGYIANEMADQSRVIVFRPRFSSNWAFFVRRYDSIEKKDFESLIIDENNVMVKKVMQGLVKSNFSIIITGEQGSGKTTLLLCIIGFFRKTTNLRVYESIFELYISKIYPKLNLLNLRGTGSITEKEALEIIRKTDGSAIVFGEVATYEAANGLIEAKQITKRSIFATNHSNSAIELIDYFRNSGLREGGFTNEKIAEEEAVKAIDFNIHMVNENGHRYIERVTEIVPVTNVSKVNNLNEAMFEFFKSNITRTYEAVDIIKYENGRYILTHELSERAKSQINKYLSLNERREFDKLFNETIGEVAYE